MKPMMLLRRAGMYVKRDPMTLWNAALVVSMILSLFGFWGFREGEIFTNAVLLMAASIVGVRFYRERRPFLVGTCVSLVLYSALMLAAGLGAAPLPWSL
ncbi:hypothetical protein [Caniella muris]|uniref:hypothetical protein n=1 Tax=Caniella muris TaxID=2941502 RepID=UPI00203B0FDA|nr:hypothetical protein [Caniella muris]